MVSDSIDKPPANNIMCDKEQQTPQDPSPPFIIPPPLFSQEIFESSSELDFKVILYKGLYNVQKILWYNILLMSIKTTFYRTRMDRPSIRHLQTLSLNSVLVKMSLDSWMKVQQLHYRAL